MTCRMPFTVVRTWTTPCTEFCIFAPPSIGVFEHGKFNKCDTAIPVKLYGNKKPREGGAKMQKNFTNEPARSLTLNIIFVSVRRQKLQKAKCHGCWENVHEGVVGYA